MRFISTRSKSLTCAVAAFFISSHAGFSQSTNALRLYSSADASRTPPPLDPNGFLLNPRWLGTETPPNIVARCRFRAVPGHLDRRSLLIGADDCLSADERTLVTLNEATSALALGAVCATGSHTGAIRGHVNWFPVTATGQMVWNSYSAGAGDHDVNIDFLTPTPNAVTLGNDRFEDYGNERGFHLESYDYETLERLPPEGNSFWHALRRVVHDKTKARVLVNDRFAIVTGIYGLDGVHGFHAELHPVFAMSVLIDVAANQGRVRERWAVMLRNLGSEGDCANGTVPFITSAPTASDQNYIVDLGKRDNAVVTRVELNSSWSSDTNYVPQYRMSNSRDGLSLVLPHPRPRPGLPDYLFLGTISVEWQPMSESAEEWRRHFIHRLPLYAHPLVKLDPLPEAGAGWAVSKAGKAPAPPVGMPGHDVYGRRPPSPLHYMESRALDSIPHALQVPAVRAERTAAWPIAESADVFCSPLTGYGDPICRGPSRLVLGGATMGHRTSPVLGYFLFPHSKFLRGEGTRYNILNVLLGLGYRFEFRREQFKRIQDGTTHAGAEVPVNSVRLTPFVAPSTVWLSTKVSIVPYTMTNIGASWATGGRGEWAWGWGVGLQAHVLRHDIFVEAQNLVRHGNFEPRWGYAAGYLAPLFR